MGNVSMLCTLVCTASACLLAVPAAAYENYSICRADVNKVRSEIVRTNYAKEDRQKLMLQQIDCALACSAGRLADAQTMMIDLRNGL